MPAESAPPQWIDTHCHLDAREFDADRPAVVARAAAAGVAMQVIPAVGVFNFDVVRALAHEHGLAYALGIHPLCVGGAADADLERLEQALQEHRDDPRLVAVGEIGVDLFEPGLVAIRPRQEHFYREQLKIARRAGLPVLVHVRRSADAVLAGLRRIEVPGGIAHAFNGSDQQAGHFVERGFRLGFGGALTFETARQIRRIAAAVPASVPVLETDSPDIPPHWIYRTAGERAAQVPPLPQGRNEPAQLARIAGTLARLRGVTLAELAAQTRANAHAVMPKLAVL
jgi:TatD DNase family protein